MQAVQADEADMHIVSLHAAALHLLHDDLCAILGLLVGVGPCEAQHGNGLPALVIADAQLQGVRPGLALDAAHADAVLAHLSQGGVADVDIDVGGQIVGRIVDLIQELLLAALLADDTAAVGSLGDLHGVLGQLGNGEAQLVHAGHVAPVIHVVAAGALAAALQKMAGHNTAGEVVPIVCSPAELILQGSQEQRAVSSTSGDNNVSAVGQAGLNALMADVCVAVVDVLDHFVEVAVVVKVGESPAILQQLGDLVLDGVAGHIADLVTGHVLAFGPLLDGIHAAGNIHAACVGADTNVLVPGFLTGGLENAGGEVGCEALGRVFQLLLSHDGERQLCQVVAAHVLNVTLADHVDGRIGTIAPEALATADCYFFHLLLPPEKVVNLTCHPVAKQAITFW